MGNVVAISPFRFLVIIEKLNHRGEKKLIIQSFEDRVFAEQLCWRIASQKEPAHTTPWRVWMYQCRATTLKEFCDHILNNSVSPHEQFAVVVENVGFADIMFADNVVAVVNTLHKALPDSKIDIYSHTQLLRDMSWEDYE